MLRHIKPAQPTAWRSILTVSFHLRLGLPEGLSPLFSQPEPCAHSSYTPQVLQASPISFVPIWSLQQHLVRSTDYTVPHYAVSSCPLLLRSPSQVLVPPSAPCSNTPTPYVTPATGEIKFHTQIKLAKPIYVHFKLYIFRQQTGRQIFWTEW